MKNSPDAIRPATYASAWSSNLRFLVSVLFFGAAAAATLGAIRTPSTVESLNQDTVAIANKIAPWVMARTEGGQQAEFIVVLSDQADLSRAATLPTKIEKGRYVYETLLNKSEATQGPIIQWLRERGVEHRSLYIVNAIWVKGTRQVAEALATRPDVARVEGNPKIQNIAQTLPVVESPSQLDTVNAIEPGIAYTNAPQVWALGFTGQGIVIGHADTGVRWTHDALKSHYRGWNGMSANHDFNWHDAIHDSGGNPCGNDAPAPCDDNGHGTHTLGTAIGDDGGANQIGMAPGAKWIGCRNVNQGIGTPVRYMECMQFFIAPYPVNGSPANGDPAKAPDVTTNSWSCPASEGCSVFTLQAAVEAQQAAGILMVVAAGSSGPGCSTIFEPPSIYEASYTVGALVTGADTIASFSGRGPVTSDGSGRIKPDITAPGTSVRSSYFDSDTSYVTASGSSVATPHVAGAVALLWSARPALRPLLHTTKDTLNDSAVHISSTLCGSAGPPNNVYGWGRLDILAAVGASGPIPTPTPTATETPTPAPTPTPTPPMPCPLGQGYWKNRPGAWPVTTLTLGGRTYTQSQLLAILNAPVKGDASLALAGQLIVALLNIANGSDPTPVSATVAHAQNLVTGCTIPCGVKPASALGQQMNADATELGRYNGNLLTPGCSP